MGDEENIISNFMISFESGLAASHLSYYINYII